MKAREFNEKYADYLEEGHYGCALLIEKQIDYLDEKFQEFILIPGFSYSQIKSKWNYFNLYAKGISDEVCTEVEHKLKEIWQNL